MPSICIILTLCSGIRRTAKIHSWMSCAVIQGLARSKEHTTVLCFLPFRHTKHFTAPNSTRGKNGRKQVALQTNTALAINQLGMLPQPLRYTAGSRLYVVLMRMMVKWVVNLRCRGGLKPNFYELPRPWSMGVFPFQGKTHMAEPGIEPGISRLVVRSSDHQAMRLIWQLMLHSILWPSGSSREQRWSMTRVIYGSRTNIADI